MRVSYFCACNSARQSRCVCNSSLTNCADFAECQTLPCRRFGHFVFARRCAELRRFAAKKFLERRTTVNDRPLARADWSDQCRTPSALTKCL